MKTVGDGGGFYEMRRISSESIYTESLEVRQYEIGK